MILNTIDIVKKELYCSKKYFLISQLASSSKTKITSGPKSSWHSRSTSSVALLANTAQCSLQFSNFHGLLVREGRQTDVCYGLHCIGRVTISTTKRLGLLFYLLCEYRGRLPSFDIISQVENGRYLTVLHVCDL